MKKVFVYDSQHGFSRFLTREFGKKFELEILKKITSSLVLENMSSKYLVAFFFIYSEKELFDFIRIYSTGVPVVVCSSKDEILIKFDTISDVILLDTSETKSEWINRFREVLVIYF